MIAFFILGLLLGALVVIFVLQNIAVVTVAFFSWQIQGSLAAILAAAVLVGVIITLLLILPEAISNYFEYKKLQKENLKLSQDLLKQKELSVVSGTPAASDVVVAKIENGEIVHPSA